MFDNFPLEFIAEGNDMIEVKTPDDKGVCVSLIETNISKKSRKEEVMTCNKSATLLLFRLWEEVNAVEDLDSRIVIDVYGIFIRPSMNVVRCG